MRQRERDKDRVHACYLRERGRVGTIGATSSISSHKDIQVSPIIQKKNIPMKAFLSQNDIKGRSNHHLHVPRLKTQPTNHTK